MLSYDLLIVGGGLAGLSAALSADPGLKVGPDGLLGDHELGVVKNDGQSG